MDALMIPVVQAPRSTAQPEAQRAVKTGKGSDFSSYMERKSAMARQERQDLLGAGRKQAVASPQPRREVGRARDTESVKGQNVQEPEEASTIAALLAQFMADLKQAADTTAPASGAWSFSITDPSQLQGIAQSAGMSDAELSVLTRKLEEQGGTATLSDLLDFLSRHFVAMQDPQPVTAPETDLPMLQNLLERLGVPAEEAVRIGEPAVRGDNTLDLEKFLAGLEQVDSQGITTLSPAETEQLQEILAQAGVSLPTQYSLLPERLPLWQEASQQNPAIGEELVSQLQQMEQPVHLTIDRLKDILEKGVADVKASRLQADLPAFLEDLQTILSRSGLEAKSPGWTPAVQGAVTSAFDKLMESVDLAQIQVRQGDRLAEIVADRHAEEDFFAGESALEELAAGQELDPLAEEAAGKDSPLTGKHGGEGSASGRMAEHGTVSGDNAGIFHAETMVARHDTGGQPTAQAVAPPRPFVPVHGMSQELQRQGFSQISQGVLQGLRNQDHHLVLKLYPKELGEVRVEMMIHEDQVAVSFAMENSKVKEVLESNLEQFKQNMEGQGFTMGECMVSVNQNNDGSEAWRQFQESWQTGSTLSPRTASTLADLPEDILYQRAGTTSGRENGVDLFA